MKKQTRIKITRVVLFILLLVPFIITAVRFGLNDLGANPVEAATHRTGIWGLRILLLSLLVTPIRILWKWREPILYRRMLGNFAFFYGVMHFGIYLVFDQGLDFSDTWADVVKRPYITVGFAALMLMLPLAVTSPHVMLKKMGAKNWRRLHKLAYLIGVLIVVHFVWLVKADVREPLTYGGIFAVLMAVRIYEWLKVKWLTKAKAETA